MKIPSTPPKAADYIASTAYKNIQDFTKLTSIVGAVDRQGRYLHWDELRYKEPIDPYSNLDIWFATKFARSLMAKSLVIKDKNDLPFKFCIPDAIFKQLHEIDQNAGGGLVTGNASGQAQLSLSYLFNSTIEEAISSSQLEGASTTRKVAKSMLRENRLPQNRSERMIFNNYNAMRFVREQKDNALTPELICELHRIVTNGTLDEPETAGRIRNPNEVVQVVGSAGEILHHPPHASSLPARLEDLCEFANTKSESIFIHPVIKAILLHFQLAYDHPFVDGNGRTARALFYWYIAKHNYWLLEYISISAIIKQAQTQYGRAFLYTETDENDTTYFILHQLSVIQKAITQLQTYIAKRQQSLSTALQLVEQTQLSGLLNRRQLELLDYALKTPNTVFRIKEHQATHQVAYQTARTDLIELADTFNLFSKVKDGRSFIFLARQDLHNYLETL